MCHINTVWVVNFLCILIFHTSAIQYTHDWAIEVDGGQDEADLVAKDTGCVNQGKKMCFFNEFFFCFLHLVGDFYFLKRTFVLDFPNPFFFIFATLSDHSDDQMIFPNLSIKHPTLKEKGYN